MPPTSSSAEGEVSALAIRADFMALGDQYLTNLNSVAHELTTERNKLRTDILQKVAVMKWKTDLHQNKTEVRVESVVEKLGEATKTCLKRLKRKAPSACKEEEVKRVKGDDGHDDQGQGHHEGEKDIAGAAGMSKTVKESEAPAEANPEEIAEESEVPAEAAEANPKIS